MTEPVYWWGDHPARDDFGDLITNEFIDGRIGHGTAWGIFTPTSWSLHGCLEFGQGHGQRYKLQPDGKFMKVEG